MATWKRVITENDNSTYKNDNISLTQLDAGLDGETGYGANKILKVNSAGDAIEWADDSGGIALDDLSVGAEAIATGNGAISYNNGTGVFVYTPPGNATASVNGLATSTQITKLDGIETGADVTPSWVPNSDPSYLTCITGAQVASALNGNLGNVTIGDSNDNITISGNLTVSGTTTTIDTTNLNVEDRIIRLGTGLTSGTGTGDIGIEVVRGTEDDQALFWDESNDRWAVGQNPVSAGGAPHQFGSATSIGTMGHFTGDTDPTTTQQYGIGSMFITNTAAGTNGNQSKVWIRVA